MKWYEVTACVYTGALLLFAGDMFYLNNKLSKYDSIPNFDAGKCLEDMNKQITEIERVSKECENKSKKLQENFSQSDSDSNNIKDNLENKTDSK